MEDLKSYHSTLVDTIEHVKRGLAAGKSLDELKADGLPERYASYGGGFINTSRWIETIYNDTKH